MSPHAVTAAAAAATGATAAHRDAPARDTQILPVNASKVGRVSFTRSRDGMYEDLDVTLDDGQDDAASLRLAAEQLRVSTIPVAFPTETVYGLGADATRSEAVKGIYAAKQRPSDNPLIVHFASLRQLKRLLSAAHDHTAHGATAAPIIPPIYGPLIKNFWPGPLTIILPNPRHSPLAPEVTAGLSTFGARIPRNLLALLLIKLSDKPIAAPSANASTRPSPTAAEHVMEDLNGRIDYIIDGGPCDVGVESTVVDGLSDPPAILRPGGISVEQIRQCEGWENVVVGYEDSAMKQGAPRAPGMKYRHYSPKARVFLYASASDAPTLETLSKQGFLKIGFICTRHWKCSVVYEGNGANGATTQVSSSDDATNNLDVPELFSLAMQIERPEVDSGVAATNSGAVTYWKIELGDSAGDVARDLFWALRELDRKGCDVICVEGISSEEGDVAAAVMNRLRKAAEVQMQS